MASGGEDRPDAETTHTLLQRPTASRGGYDVLVSDTGTAALTYTDNTVAASLTYTYRIKAINEHGVSERSRWFHVDVPAAPEAAEGDEQDGEDDGGGAPGGPGKKSSHSEGSTTLVSNIGQGTEAQFGHWDLCAEIHHRLGRNRVDVHPDRCRHRL